MKEWVGEEEQAVRGLGQRTYLVGEADQPILALGQIEFETSGNEAEPPNAT